MQQPHSQRRFPPSTYAYGGGVCKPRSNPSSLSQMATDCYCDYCLDLRRRLLGPFVRHCPVSSDLFGLLRSTKWNNQNSNTNIKMIQTPTHNNMPRNESCTLWEHCPQEIIVHGSVCKSCSGTWSLETRAWTTKVTLRKMLKWIGHEFPLRPSFSAI